MKFNSGLRSLSGVLAISAFTLASTLVSGQGVVQGAQKAPTAEPSRSTTIAPSSPSTVFTPDEDYVLGSGDVIYVAIYADPDLSRDCRIAADGTIVMAYLPEKIRAAGKTAEQLQDEISAAYKAKNILKNPQATVTVKEFHSSPVSVGGSVVKQTTFQVQGHTTLWQAIMMAEGFTGSAGTKIIVTHAPEAGPDGKKAMLGETVVISRHDLRERPNDPNVNVVIKGGDTIVVTPAEYVFVGGAVTKPGMLSVGDVSDWTLLKALAAVGNMTKVAAMEHAVIRRDDGNGTKKDIPVDLKRVLKREDPDLPLYANDILLIPDSPTRKALYKAADTLTGLTSGLALVAAGH